MFKITITYLDNTDAIITAVDYSREEDYLTIIQSNNKIRLICLKTVYAVLFEEITE